MPSHLYDEEEVAIAPARESVFNFISAKILRVNSDKTVEVMNESTTPILVKKNSVIGDLTALKDVAIDKVSTKTTDETHLKRPAIFSTSEAGKSYTDQILIDPDNQLDKIWRETFCLSIKKV